MCRIIFEDRRIDRNNIISNINSPALFIFGTATRTGSGKVAETVDFYRKVLYEAVGLQEGNRVVHVLGEPVYVVRNLEILAAVLGIVYVDVNRLDCRIFDIRKDRVDVGDFVDHELAPEGDVVRHALLELEPAVVDVDVTGYTGKACLRRHVRSLELAVIELVAHVCRGTGTASMALHVVTAHNEGAELVIYVYVVRVVRVCEDYVGAD